MGNGGTQPAASVPRGGIRRREIRGQERQQGEPAKNEHKRHPKHDSGQRNGIPCPYCHKGFSGGAEGRKALITFITAGDGGYDCTEKAVLEMAKNGADLIELGVPFSDPIAEGPVIQRASERSLQNGTTLVGIFDLVRRLRKETDVPLLLMMYLNTIFRFGTDRFFALCEECGIDGVIVPDIPFEEKDEIPTMYTTSVL